MIASPTAAPVAVPGSSSSWDIEQIYGDYRERLYRYLSRRVSDSDLAEDLTQEVFMRALRALPSLPADLNLNAWLYRIATNLAIDALRRRRLVAWASLEALDGEPASGMHDDPQTTYSARELVAAALARMKPSYRRALLLHLWAGYGLPQVAQQLGLGQSPSAIKMYLSRGRLFFKEHYAALQRQEQEVSYE